MARIKKSICIYFIHDKSHRLIKTTDPISGQGSQEFDLHGNRSALIDPNSNRTSYIYDTADRLTGGNTYLEYNPRNFIA